MKKLLFGTAIVTVLFGFTSVVQAEKPTFSYVLAGSPSGTFNRFNKELIKDLKKYYNVNAVPGHGEVKGTTVFKKIDGPAYVMVRSGMLNAKQSLSGNDPVIANVIPNSIVMSIGYYKTFCVAGNKSVDSVLLNGFSTHRIAFSDGIKLSTKFLDNLNRATNSKNVMVPYDGSGAAAKATIIGETAAVMVTEAKTPKFISKGQLSCKYSTNPNSPNPISARLKDDWFGWSYGNLAFGHTKNMTDKEVDLLHQIITKIMTDPTSNAGKKARSTHWQINALDKAALFTLYEQSKEDTLNLLK